MNKLKKSNIQGKEGILWFKNDEHFMHVWYNPVWKSLLFRYNLLVSLGITIWTIRNNDALFHRFPSDVEISIRSIVTVPYKQQYHRVIC